MTVGKTIFVTVTAAMFTAAPLTAQTVAPVRVEVAPAALSLAVGDTVQLEAKVYDADGNQLETPVMFFSTSRRRLDVARTEGTVAALKGGDYQVIVFVPTARNVRAQIPVSVAYPPVTRVTMSDVGPRLYVGATVPHEAAVYDAAADHRTNVSVQWSTDDPSIASVNRFGVMSVHRAGTVTLSASAEDVTAIHTYEVADNPIRTVTVAASADSARTGDVLHFAATALDGRGQRIEDATIHYTLLSNPEDSVVAQFPAAEIDEQGRFVAQKAGVYTVLAVAPGHVAQHTVEITNRLTSQRVEFIGHGAVRDVATSDL